MRIRLLFPVLTSAALIALAAGGIQAGSFFGPSCYGQDYAYQYPNRAHNVFGCGPGTHCQARHPIFKHRWARRHQGAPNDGMPINAMSGYGMPVNGMPINGMPVNGVQVNGMPIEFMPAPVVQSPVASVPVHMTSVAPAPVPVSPAVQSRLVPTPAPMPSGPTNAQPSSVDASGKPPF